VRAQKSAALVCAAALALNCAALPILASTPTLPDTITLNRLDPSEASNSIAGAAVESRADAAPNVATNDSTDGANKKGGNAFLRALAAPFRALARLFGEGKKNSSTSDVAKTKQETTKTNAAAVTNVATVAPPAATHSPSAVTPTTLPALTFPAASPASPAQTTAATVTPPAAPTMGERETTTNAPFTPLVVGVRHDPISQGRALINEGLIESAISELSVAAATGVNLLEANNLLGLAYDRRGQHKEAQGFYERALTVAPNDAHVINNLGYSLYLDDRPQEALAKLKLAAKLDPSSREIYNNLGFVCGKLAKYADAFRNFARAGGELYARYQTGALLETAGRDRDAIKHYEAARKIDPTSTEVLRRLINLYNRTGQRDKAEAAERALEQPKSKAVGSATG
jgi:tetratricopeptide (TPR) repeat protein